MEHSFCPSHSTRRTIQLDCEFCLLAYLAIYLLSHRFLLTAIHQTLDSSFIPSETKNAEFIIQELIYEFSSACVNLFAEVLRLRL